jgi:hypothetical protein
VPQRLFMYQHNGRDSGHVRTTISRFIPKSIHHAFELQHWSDRSRDPTTGPIETAFEKVDVAASIERMWR